MLLFFLFSELYAYRLKDEDVTVVNGIITRCVYDISTKGNIIEIPDVLHNQTITGIGDYAFSVAGKIAVLTLPSTLQTIGNGVFEGHALTSLEIPKGVTSIGHVAFYNNAISHVVLPDGLVFIGDRAFENNQLTDINLPAGIEFIGWGAFQNNRIVEVNIPNSLKTLREAAFNNNKITVLNFQDSCQLKEISGNCFAGNDIKNLNIPNSVLSIEDYAFNYNPNLSKVTFGTGLLKIKRGAFSGCNLSQISFPGSLVFIGRFAFEGNPMLSNFRLPASAKNYQWNDSNGDVHNAGDAVTEKSYSYVAKIPYTLKDEDVLVANGVIINCPYFNEIANIGSIITIPSTLDGQKISGIAGGVFHNRGISEIILPNDIVFIGSDAFSRNELIHLIIPGNLKTIGDYAFMDNCINSITFEATSSLDIIGIHSFQSNRLKSIDFPRSVKKIEKNAFDNNFLQKVNFEENSQLLSIGSYAFFNNWSLPGFTLPGPRVNGYDYWIDWDENKYSSNLTVTDFETFYKIPIEYTLTDADVVVENGVIISYTPLNPYANMLTIPEMLDGQKIIGIWYEVFARLGLVGVVFPPSLIIINDGAFSENDILKISIPASVQEIRGSAFAQNIIREIHFEEHSKLRYIGGGAFWGNKISTLLLPDSVNHIDHGAFGSNRISNTIVIPDSVKFIGGHAFAYNQIPELIFGENSQLSFLGEYAFANNFISNTLYMPKTLTEISNYAFIGNRIRFVITHERIVDYGNGAFQYNDPLLEIVLHKPPTIPFVTHFFGWKDDDGVFYDPGEKIPDFGKRYKAVIDQYFVVKFIVEDDNGIPLENAIIEFYSTVLTTNVHGVDSIGPVMRGLQQYKVSGVAGCYDFEGVVDVQDDMTVLITLIRFYNVTIKVVDINSNPIGNAELFFNDSYFTFGPTGSIHFELPDGEYPVVVNAAGYQESTSSFTVLDADTEIIITLNPLLINYFANGGTGVDFSETSYGSSYLIKENLFTLSAYTFSHWNTKPDNSGQSYSEKESIAPGYSDIDLFAIWNPVNYNIIYHLDGGNNHPDNPSNYTIESEINLLPASKTSLYFATWLDADSNRVNRIEKGNTGDIELWAVFTTEPTYFIDYFNLENASHTNQSFYTRFNLPFAFTDAIKKGYDFLGWYEDPLFTRQITNIPVGSAKDYEVYAKWGGLSEYTITYHLNSGTNNPSNPDSYTIESSPVTFQPPSKPGAGFLGWYSDAAFTGKITGIPTGSMGDTAIYAKWELNDYRIEYVLNGGTNNPSNPDVYTVESSPISFQPPTRPGAGFLGWYSDAALTGKITGIPTGSMGDTTVYAKWQLDGFAIVYALNGGANNPSNPDSYTIESSQVTFLPPTRAGAGFLGWYSDAAFTGKITGIPTGSTGDTAIYAKWELNDYRIEYVLNGGTNNPSNPDVYTVESSPISFQPPTRPGAGFLGWSSDEALTGKITGIPTGSMGDTTVYAKWQLDGFAIVYVLNGGANNPSNPDSYTIESSPVTFQPPSKPGAGFLGWYSDSAFTGKINGIPTGSMGDTAIYAKWELNDYRIEYVLNGGTNNPSNPDVYTVESSPISFQPPTRPGAGFLGWYSDAALTGKITGIHTGSMGDTTVYAKWELDVFSIEYVLNGGENNSDNPDYYTIESDTIFFEIPSKTGFRFVAWHYDEKLTNIISFIPKGSMGDTTLYAKWEIEEYIIHYELDGGDNNPANPGKYTIESGTIILEDPAKTGSVFAGWYSDSGYTNRIASIPQGSRGNVVIYAKWIEIFKVSFIITTDGFNPAKDVDIIIGKTQKLKSDLYGLSDTLMQDGSSLSYSIEINGIVIENGSATISGSDVIVRVEIVDCYMRWFDVLFCDNGKGLWTNFVWYKDNDWVSNEQFYHHPGGIEEGYYKLIVTSVDGVEYIWESKYKSNNFEVNLQRELNSEMFEVKVFPSPVARGEYLKILLSETLNLHHSIVLIYSVKGELILVINNPSYMNEIDINNTFSSGLYHVAVLDVKNRRRIVMDFIVN